jgi:hypothetical protein
MNGTGTFDNWLCLRNLCVGFAGIAESVLSTENCFPTA